MNFSVHLDDTTAARLAALARSRAKTRNALVKRAITELLDREDEGEWPADVLEFLASPNDGFELTPFESHRADLLEPPAPSF